MTFYACITWIKWIGMVFWYATPNEIATNFYGYSSKFKGFALVFDTADPSSKRYNPFIYGIYNDGTKVFDETIDYTNSKSVLGSCFRYYLWTKWVGIN